MKSKADWEICLIERNGLCSRVKQGTHSNWRHSEWRRIWMSLARWIMMGKGYLRQRDHVPKEAPTPMTETRGWIQKCKGNRKPCQGTWVYPIGKGWQVKIFELSSNVIRPLVQKENFRKPLQTIHKAILNREK